MQHESTPPSDEATPADTGYGARDVLHWYDFLCPFCYIGQQRNTIFERHGLRVIDIPLEAHPEIPPEGQAMQDRLGPMYESLEAQARAAGLPLKWPPRLPNTRTALAAAEWTRRYAPGSFPGLEKTLFAAHFARGEDLGNLDTILRHARDNGVDVFALRAALSDGSANEFVDRSEGFAKRIGIHGTPAWFVAGRLISGLYPEDHFDRLARALARSDTNNDGE
jgi:predicted DsbA family dithiol-disulfide isomerase